MSTLSSVPPAAEAGPSRLTLPASRLSPHAQRLALDFANIRWAPPPEGDPSSPRENAAVTQYFPQQITISQSFISAEGRNWTPEPNSPAPVFTSSDKRILHYWGVPSVQVFHLSPIDEHEPDEARRLDIQSEPDVGFPILSSSRNVKQEAPKIRLSFDHTDAAYDEGMSVDNDGNRTSEASSRASSATGCADSQRIETFPEVAPHIERRSESGADSPRFRSGAFSSQSGLEDDDSMEVVACGSDGLYSGRETVVGHSHASMHPWDYVKGVLNSPHGICVLFRPAKTEDLPAAITEVQEAGLYAGVVGRAGHWWIVLTNEADKGIMRRPSEIVDILMPRGSLATEFGALPWGADAADIAEHLEYAIYETACIPGTAPTLPAQFMQGTTGGIVIWWSKSIIGKAASYALP